MLHLQRSIVVAFFACAAVLSSCGHAATKLAIDDRATPTPTSATMPTTTTATVDKAAVARWNRAVWNNAVWVNAVKHAEAVKTKVRAGVVVSQPRPAAVSVPTDIAGVMACLKGAESGNYSEASHIQDGSGAFQAIPSTWRAWSARAGYPGYAYEYQAPPAVQDAVVAFMLTNGGSHNWDPKYGRDSCTVGMP